MPNQLPVTADFGALPMTAQGYNPQELADRLGLNFRLFTAQSFALFVTGATAPTSDVGPWAKNGNSWYYWDSVSGSYVPFTIEQESLGYYIGEVAPDQLVYQFWIRTTAAGSPLGISIYYAGAWTDIAGLITPNEQSANYTLVLSDGGKNIFHPTSDSTPRTFTIPANTSVAFPLGTAVTFTNQNAAGAITIAITTDTMRLAGSGSTGSRTLAPNGIATALKITATEWIISGTGIS